MTKLVRMLGSAVTTQALTSAGSFLVGLILIRRAADAQYGYYVLVANAIQLMTILQQSFIQPLAVTRLPRYDRQQRADLVGAIYGDQRRWLPLIPITGAVVGGILRVGGVIGTPMFCLLLAACAAVSAALYRESLRIVLLAYRRPESVLRADFVYVALLIAGVWLATFASTSSVLAVMTLAVAGTVGGMQCSRSLWRFEPWNRHAPRGTFVKLIPLGFWAATGTMVHWLFTQGYSYVVAATLDVTAVAAIAAVRLLIMPVNLLSTGLGSIMLPTISNWLKTHDTRKVLTRQLGVSLALAAAAACYFLVLWLAREWIFDRVLHKQSPVFDSLLLLWSAIALFMLFRDQLIYVLIVRSRFRPLAALTFVSAVIAMFLSYVAMKQWGVVGALGGVLVGEILNVCGIVYLCVVEARRPEPVTVPGVT